jgi:hypothetical protein
MGGWWWVQAMAQPPAEQVGLLDSNPEVAMVHGAMLYWHSWDSSATRVDNLVLTAGPTDASQEFTSSKRLLLVHGLRLTDSRRVERPYGGVACCALQCEEGCIRIWYERVRSGGVERS